MRNLLYTLGLWLIRVSGHTLPVNEKWRVPAVVEELRRAAARECAAQETDRPDATGENKRHQVYAALIKKFPQARKRDIGLAIELALR
jgi:hypothetical protein